MFMKQLAKLSEINKQEYHAIQHDLLKATYLDAVNRVPFYLDNSDYPKVLNDAEFMDTFMGLPLLEKLTLKQSPELFIRRPKSKCLLKHTTGGTTGSPLTIYQTPVTRMKTTAVLQASYKQFLGLANPRVLNLTGFLKGDDLWREVPASNTAYLSIYKLEPARQAEISAFLKNFRPQVIHGFPSALLQLALLYPEGLPGTGVDEQLRCISTSETLMEKDREVIEANLRAIVHNQYGSQEGQHFVFECRERGLHVHPERGLLEILKFEEDVPVQPGESGRVVVTGFHNLHMPLIRYSIGDTATRPREETICACGCRWPVIQDIQGRTSDLVRTPDGRRIGAISGSTLKNLKGILESQIVQTAYDHFIYKMCVTSDYKRQQAEAHVQYELNERLGYPVTVDFEYLSSIKKTSSGKHQAVIVDIK